MALLDIEILIPVSVYAAWFLVELRGRTSVEGAFIATQRSIHCSVAGSIASRPFG